MTESEPQPPLSSSSDLDEPLTYETPSEQTPSAPTSEDPTQVTPPPPANQNSRRGDAGVTRERRRLKAEGVESQARICRCHHHRVPPPQLGLAGFDGHAQAVMSVVPVEPPPLNTP